ncbi:carboxylesterase/lipase family protein [Rhodopseudomonas sp. P2A-2r]|uniref:carboxylesterase/lipase family protein n=1 Tax=unclassified Rhodopseudomonas TaxID=2638247 RepID=UPI002233EE02|nr:carboxylesterase/lipase family protein [Rhodopseudomonas sp. P2A-2r]UZE50353.1 carboxylesterase/lipase family protein [Rhodopseudomonas sp. P2A-2r]
MNPVIETRQGKLRGCSSNGVTSFKGVRYAAPPFGAHRLQPPQPVQPWDGVRDAQAFGPKPPQVDYPPGISEFLLELVGPGEDCLTLNIWTPDTGTAGLPVMVWIPGGMFEFHATGATPFYDGSRFARDGAVCVTINYRVGADGFLYFADGVANPGLLDQIAALRWVQDNIAAFGGDRDRVAVFGESAGGMSVATLLTMPRTKGLFHRAIVQSGNTPIVNSAATARRIGQRLADILGVPATRAAIAAMSTTQILQAQAKLRAELIADPDPTLWGEVALSYLPWAPVVDGKTIPQPPIDAIAAGAAADIDLLVGSNEEETRLFFVSDGSIDRIPNAAVVALAAAYELSGEGLSGYRAAYPDATAGELLSAIQTDWYWRLPAVRLADAHASRTRASTYMYEFAWRSPLFDGRLGAAHSMEIPFVFDTLGLGTQGLLGDAPPQALATAMHAAWIAFARTGDCGWAKYDSLRRSTMHFDATLAVIDDPMAARRTLWKNAC